MIVIITNENRHFYNFIFFKYSSMFVKQKFNEVMPSVLVITLLKTEYFEYFLYNA